MLIAITLAPSLTAAAQAAETDWWPMFRHDLNRTGTTTSTGTIRNSTLWTYTTSGPVYSSPAVDEGLLYVGSYDNRVYCLNASTGTHVWNYSTNAVVHSSPAIVDGRVYVGTGETGSYGWIYCLNATTGTLIWSFQTSSFDQRLGGVISSPAVVDGFVYVGCDDGIVYCLNATTGTVAWYVGASGSIVSSPAIVGGLVYVGASDGWIYCRNASDGSEVWSYQAGNGVYSSPAVVGGKLFVGSVDDRVYCLNASTGAQIWNYTTGNYIDSSPAAFDDVVYVGSWDGKIYCLNATSGTLVWNYTTGASVQSSPAVASGLVYVGSNDTNIYCLNSATGSLIWSFKTGGPVVSCPAIVNGAVYVGSTDDNVYAISPYVTVSITPALIVMDATQSQLFSSNVTHGTLPFSYQWYLNGAPVTDALSSAWTFTPASPGPYTVYVDVTDSDGASSKSNTAIVTVNSAPLVSISPASLTIDVGQSRQFTSTISGGTPPYYYQWYLNGSLIPGATSDNWTFEPTSSGNYTVYLYVSDSAGANAASHMSSITVNAAIPEFQPLFILPFFLIFALLFTILLRPRSKFWKG